MDRESILRRIVHLEGLAVPMAAASAGGANVGEMYQGAVQLLTLTHGPSSPQALSLLTAFNSLESRNSPSLVIQLQPMVLGTLRALKAEVEADLLVAIERRGTGEALADVLVLAKEALRSGTKAGTNVAAVLAAALYEDTLRRMGAALAEMSGRPELHEVIVALKKAGVLQGGLPGIAQSYLRFRNDALHADWEGITSLAVEQCLGFSEGLIKEHFAGPE